MSLANVLAADPGRCSNGFSIEHHHPQLCGCVEGSEWSVFVAALKQARDGGGRISQTDVRPLIAGRVQPRHVGTLYQRAVREGLIRRDGREDSTDVHGRNGDKLQWVYRWVATRTPASSAPGSAVGAGQSLRSSLAGEGRAPVSFPPG